MNSRERMKQSSPQRAGLTDAITACMHNLSCDCLAGMISVEAREER